MNPRYMQTTELLPLLQKAISGQYDVIRIEEGIVACGDH